MADSFKMPIPGSIVRWMACPGDRPVPAIVTEVSRYSVGLAVCAPDSGRLFPKQSVRFHADPWLNEHGLNTDAGVWDHSSEYYRIKALEERLDELYELMVDNQPVAG